MIKETNFQYLTKLYQSYISEISWNQEPISLYEPFDYIMQQEGKKIRPLSLLLSYGLFSDNLTAALPAAYGLELFHNFTLIHDDIMDQAALRRGKPTVHQKYGDSSAILSGDAMLLESLQMILKAAGPRNAITQLFINSGLEVCRGQAMDMDFENSQSVRLPDYLQMIEKKTSVLLGCCLQIGAMLADQPEKICNTLYQIGLNLGNAFQIQDDIMDLHGDTTSFGKTRGGDLIQRKKTILLLTLLEDFDQKGQQEILAHYQKQRTPQEQLAFYEDILDRHDIKNKARHTFEDYCNRCYSEIKNLDLNEPGMQQLTQFVSLVLNRNY